MSLSIGKKRNHFDGVTVAELCTPLQFQWNKSDKIDQYKRIELMLQRNLDLERAKYDLERIAKQQRLNELRQNVKETKLKLNKLKVGECDVIKHILRGFKSSIRLGKSLDTLFEHCDCKRNKKRRELDRLNDEMNKLSDAYASKLILLNKMQDRRCRKWSSESSKLLASRMKKLDKSEIEIKNYEKLVKDLKRAVKQLSKESLQYANSLKAVEMEINKKNELLGFLRKVSVVPEKQAKKNRKEQPQMAEEEQVFDESNDDFEVPERHESKTIEVENRQPLEESTNHSPIELTTLNSIVKRIQSKLAAGKENVNILGNEFNGKTEDDAMRSNHQEDDCNREQLTHDLQTKQNDSAAFQRIPMGLLKVRGVLQRFHEFASECKRNKPKN